MQALTMQYDRVDINRTEIQYHLFINKSTFSWYNFKNFKYRNKQISCPA